MLEFLNAIPIKDIFTLFFFFFMTESVVQIFKSLDFWPFNRINTPGRLKVFVFFVAWAFAGAADYGVLTSLVEIGENAKPFLRFFDYFGTAAIVSRFSGLTYKQIEALLAKAEQKRADATKPKEG